MNSTTRNHRRAPGNLTRAALCLVLTLALAQVAPLGRLAAQELPRVAPAEAGFSAERLGRIDDLLQGYVDDGKLPGAAVMILRDGSVVHESVVGYRDVEAADPLASDAIFRIASQTKAVVSVAVLMLQEEGRLLISDRLAHHLPAFERTNVAEAKEGGGYEVVRAERSITLRDLLTHTAGIGYGWGRGNELWREAGITGWYFADRTEPIRATVDRMAELPFQAQPGERWVYGYATDILGAVVEEASGQPLDEFLRERIFDPLDMRDTHFYLPPDKADRLAVVYGRAGAGGLNRADPGAGMNTQGDYVTGPRTSFSGGAGLLSTPRDYARFLQMMLGGGRLGDARILSPSSVTLMTANHVGDLYTEGMGFGLGFDVRLDVGTAGEVGSEGEYGWGGAYHTTYWVDPAEGLVVVYFTQVIPAIGLDDHDKLRALVYAALEERRGQRPGPASSPSILRSQARTLGTAESNIRS